VPVEGYGYLYGSAGKGCWREVRWLECGRQGRGNKFPFPVSPSPNGDIPTVHSMGRSWKRAGYGFPPASPRIRFPAGSTPDTAFPRLHPKYGFPPAPPRIRFPTGFTPGTVSHQLHPGYGCSPDIATHGPRPRDGAGAERRRRGWGGGAGRSVWGVCRRRRGQGMLARSKMVGVWETGEGEQVPPPRQPLPQWRYPHGPLHGEILEKSRIRFPAGSTPDTVSHQLHPGYGFPPAPPQIRFPAGSTPGTAAHLISPRTDPAPGRGRGRSAEGAGGEGAAGEVSGYPS